jgi:hypothetical protein
VERKKYGRQRRYEIENTLNKLREILRIRRKRAIKKDMKVIESRG